MVVIDAESRKIVTIDWSRFAMRHLFITIYNAIAHVSTQVERLHFVQWSMLRIGMSKLFNNMRNGYGHLFIDCPLLLSGNANKQKMHETFSINNNNNNMNNNNMKRNCHLQRVEIARGRWEGCAVCNMQAMNVFCCCIFVIKINLILLGKWYGWWLNLFLTCFCYKILHIQCFLLIHVPFEQLH